MAWMRSNRSWIFWPKTLTSQETRGSGASARSVSRQSSSSIRLTVVTIATAVLAEYMMPGPTRFRTAFRSFVSFDIRSPVRVET